MRTLVLVLALGCVGGVAVRIVTAAPDPDDEPKFTSTFRVEREELASCGTNPWFVLEPGWVLELGGKDDGEDAHLTITVTTETKKVDGVETRVVEEREEKGGALVEVSRNYFAISKKTNAVYYFGEDVDVYRDGKVTGHGGSWQAGEGGARCGLMMPGTPLVGGRYYQEIAPGIAMDKAEIVSVDAKITTPAGALESCVDTREIGLGEEGCEAKTYAPGIGIVRDGPLRLLRRPGCK